jgi:hypothetical protein
MGPDVTLQYDDTKTVRFSNGLCPSVAVARLAVPGYAGQDVL